MNEFLRDLAVDRQAFLDGRDRNQGDINLDIFEDFYPDQAHFVYELLQNAEDAGATSATFALSSGQCVFEHNGSRVFSEKDVRSITGIHSSTKKQETDQIGKWGVGFKSVSVYTQTPIVYSGVFAFRILELIKPQEVPADPTVGKLTRFVLPFNGVKKSAPVAFDEIATALSQISENTLLFLSNLESIRWVVEGAASGEVLRVAHSDSHLEVVRMLDSHQSASTHFLRFHETVPGHGSQRVAVAFALAPLPDVIAFDARKPIASQLQIVPARPGQVSVYFPAQKETSGLRFHLDGPFVPELSRASIKDTKANVPLFSQIAAFAPKVLRSLKSIGMLTPDLLAVLPNSRDSIPAQYCGVRDEIKKAMLDEALTPAFGGGHAPARTLLQCRRRALKELLSSEDLCLLDPLLSGRSWAPAAMQNTDADRFIESLDLARFEVDDLLSIVADRSSVLRRFSEELDDFTDHPDPLFARWLTAKSIAWHQQLYSVLSEGIAGPAGYERLKHAKIVRLKRGGYALGRETFFPSTDGSDEREGAFVEPGTFQSGRADTEKEQARKFLEGIGVREIGESGRIEAILTSRYSSPAGPVGGLQTHWGDLRRFVTFVEENADRGDLFGDFFIFRGADGIWRKPVDIFVDGPFIETGLSVWHAAVALPGGPQPLDQAYEQSEIDPGVIGRFAASVRAQDRLSISIVSCDRNPDRDYLRSALGDRVRSPVDQDFQIENLPKALRVPSLDVARVVWLTMQRLDGDEMLRATYQKTAKGGAHQSDSQLVHSLKQAPWVPQGEDRFVRPSEAARAELPDGFPFDPGWPWIKAIAFGAQAAAASVEEVMLRESLQRLGLPEESLSDIRRFIALTADAKQRVLAAIEREESRDLPRHEPSNPERRAERIRDEAPLAPVRRGEERLRTVSVGPDEARATASPQLQGWYTRQGGKMICQICRDTLPFAMDDGSYYFETVVFLPDLRRLYAANYLALCPNHAAMFKHANGSRAELREAFLGLTGENLELTLAKSPAFLYFTKTHIDDLRAVLDADTRMEGDE